MQLVQFLQDSMMNLSKLYRDGRLNIR